MMTLLSSLAFGQQFQIGVGDDPCDTTSDWTYVQDAYCDGSYDEPRLISGNGQERGAVWWHESTMWEQHSAMRASMRVFMAPNSADTWPSGLVFVLQTAGSNAIGDAAQGSSLDDDGGDSDPVWRASKDIAWHGPPQRLTKVHRGFHGRPDGEGGSP